MSFFNADTLISGTDGLVLKDLGSAATTPSSGYGSVYVNADVLYFKTDGGTSTSLLSGGSPGGSDNHIQFNNSSSFGGSSDLTWDDTNLILSSGKGVVFVDTGEKISGDGSNITIASGRSILLTATSNIVLPSSVPLSFATDDAEKITGDGTDLTINSGRHINLTCASGDVIIPANIGLVLDGSGNEKIESDGTDISFSVGSGGDINIPSDIGLTFGHASAQKIEGDGSNITVSSGRSILLTATSNVVVSSDMEVSGNILGSLVTKTSRDGLDSCQTLSIYTTKIGGVINTEILIDIEGLATTVNGSLSFSNGTIIADSDSDASTINYLIHATAANFGHIYQVTISCIESPTYSSGTVSDNVGVGYDAASNKIKGNDITKIVSIEGAVKGKSNQSNIMSDNLSAVQDKYIYLVHTDTSSDAGTYTAGKFMIRLIGVQTF